MEVNDLYYNKYLKYKNKYINLQSQIGGFSFIIILGRINLLLPLLTKNKSLIDPLITEEKSLSDHSLTNFNNMATKFDWKFIVSETCQFYHREETSIVEQKKFLTWLNNKYIENKLELEMHPMLFLFYNQLIKCIISTFREESIKQTIKQIIDKSINLINTIEKNKKYDKYPNVKEILETALTDLRQFKINM